MVRADRSSRPVLHPTTGPKLWRAALATVTALCAVLAAQASATEGPLRVLELPVIESVQPLRVGAEAPGFQLAALDGSRVDFEKTRREGVNLLVFWSAFDPGGQPLVSVAEELLTRYGPSGLRVLGVATDGEVMRRTILRTVRALRLSFPVCIDPPGADETLPVAFAYGVRATPTVYVVDRKGRIAWVGEGYPPAAELEEAIRKAIASDAAE